MTKKYILPILLGCIAGAITIWAFDSFEPQNPQYFIKAFLKALLPTSIAVLIVQSLRKRI